jgi:hypothetical protein
MMPGTIAGVWRVMMGDDRFLLLMICYFPLGVTVFLAIYFVGYKSISRYLLEPISERWLEWAAEKPEKSRQWTGIIVLIIGIAFLVYICLLMYA